MRNMKWGFVRGLMVMAFMLLTILPAADAGWLDREEAKGDEPANDESMMVNPAEEPADKMTFSSDQGDADWNEEGGTLSAASVPTQKAEIDQKANDIRAQEKHIQHLEESLDREKKQLEQMKSDFCQNFPGDCSKISGSVLSGFNGGKKYE